MENENVTITLLNEQGQEYDCTVLTVFEKNGRDYIALLPVVETETSIQIYRYKTTMQDGVEGIEIFNILSDMEFEEALAVFKSLIKE